MVTIQIQDTGTISPQQQMPQSALTGDAINGPGRALEHFADASLRVIKAYDKEQEKLATYDAATKLEEFKTNQQMALDESLRHSSDNTPKAGNAEGVAPVPGANLATNFMGSYSNSEQKLMESIDPRVADKIRPHVTAMRGQFTVSAYRAQQAATDQWQEETIKKQFNIAAKQIDADPSDAHVDDVTRNMMTNIDMTTLPDDTISKYKDAWRSKIAPTAVFNADVVRDPDKARQDWGGYKPPQAAPIPFTKFAGAVAPGDGTNAANKASALGLSRSGPMATVTSASGAQFQVAAPIAHQFGNFITGLEAEGYAINPKTSGGYANRTIAGTNTPSQHAFGNAIDINWDKNTVYQDGKNELPPNIKKMAEDNGLVWGGDFHKQDTMHFEVSKSIPKEKLPVYAAREGQGIAYKDGASAVANTPRSTIIQNPRQLMVLKAVRDKATSEGLDPDLAAASLYMENGKMDPDSVSATGMKGLFQLDEEHRTKYGETDSVEGQVHAGVLSLKERSDAAKKFLGRDPEKWESYLFHYQGEAGAAAILKGNPQSSVYDALAAGTSKGHADAVLAGNPDMRNKSVAQFLGQLQIKMNNALNVTGGKYNPDIPTTDPKYATVSYDDMLKFRQTADQAVAAKNAAEAKAQSQYTEAVQEATMKEIYTMSATTGLTTQDVLARRDYLDSTHFNTALKLAEPADSKFDPETYVKLMGNAKDPKLAESSIGLAAQAYHDGKLPQGTFKEIYSQAQKTISGGNTDDITEAARSRILNSGYQTLKGMISPKLIAGLQDPDGQMAYNKARLALDTWSAKHPNANAEDLNKAIMEIGEPIKQERDTDSDALAGAIHVGAKSVDAATPPQIAKKSGENLIALKAGKMSESEFKTRSKQIMALQRKMLDKGSPTQ